jgi:hypothetical protein
MMHRARSLPLSALILAAACSDSRNAATRSGSAGAAGSADPPAEAAGAPPTPTFRGTVPMKISVKVGDATYRAEGLGECASSDQASIYGAPATQWAARHDGEDGSDLGSLNLTVWRLKSGGEDQANLSILIEGEDAHQVATVKGGEIVGRGKAGVRPAGKGGVLTVQGEDGHGDAIQLSVECARFDEVVAEGG